VHFLGPRDDVGPAYDAADVLVHPTREDSFAMVVPEAMAHGLPVVVSAAPWCGISELLRDGEDALLLRDPLDAGRLAACVDMLLQDAALRGQLRDAGLAFAAAHTWAAAAQAFEAIYAESMTSRRAERGTGRRAARPGPGFPPSRE
jgi:UDP-glucose:(heptosyl)LPS alpha-1,3-glucosyltransferase